MGGIIRVVKTRRLTITSTTKNRMKLLNFSVRYEIPNSNFLLFQEDSYKIKCIH